MKKEIVLVFLLFAIACSGGADSEAVSGDENSGDGMLKRLTVRVISYYDGRQSNGYIGEQTEYDREGNITKRTYFNENGSIDRCEKFTYDEKGREIEDVYYLADTIRSITKTEYDERDSVKAYIVCHPNGKLNFTHHLFYNEDGQNHRIVAVYSDGSEKFHDEFYINDFGNWDKWERYGPDSSIILTVKYEYDENQCQTKSTASGLMGGTYETSYDDQRRAVEEIGTNTDDGTFLWVKTFKYDEAGRLKKIIEFNSSEDVPGMPERVYEYEYLFY